MTRKKNEDNQLAEAKPKTRIVEATTTRKWKEPITVPIDDVIDLEPEIEDLEPDDEESDFEEIEVESRPRRSPTVVAKGKFKEALNLMGIGNKEVATLRIDRLVNYKDDGNESLRGAETAFVDKINITPGEIKDEKHLVLLKNYGPGFYRLSLRHGSTNLGIWKEKIDGPAAPPQTTRTEGEVYSASGQMPFYPAPQAPAVAPKSLKEQLSEAVELLTLVRKIDGRSESNYTQNPPAPAPVPEDIQLASILMKDPDIKAKAIKGLLGTAGQDTDITSLLIENGPALLKAAGEMLQGVIQQAVIGIDHIRSQNGQAQAGAQTVQERVSTHLPGQQPETDSQEWVQQAQAPLVQGMANGSPSNQDPAQNVSPEDQALDFILGQCAQKVPIKIAADRLFNVAEEIRGKSPANSIDGYVEMFADTPLDFLVQWLGSTYPDSQTVLDMPHAKDWIAGLQEEVKRQINEGGEDER